MNGHFWHFSTWSLRRVQQKAKPNYKRPNVMIHRCIAEKSVFFSVRRRAFNRAVAIKSGFKRAKVSFE